MDGFSSRSRLALLLESFGEVEDDRAPWRVAHPLNEVLLLVVCATIADCDDFEAMAEWGEARIDFLRGFSSYYHGVPSGRWLNALVNRIDPDMFARAFRSWAAAAFPEAARQIALDGKTSRRSHDRLKGVPALHLVSAFATEARLVLAQAAVPEKANELSAIPLLLAHLAQTDAIAGALVSIDAIACNPKIAQDILDVGADYVLAVKDNQSGLKDEILRYFADAPPDRLDSFAEADKGHGRIEERCVRVGRDLDWMDAGRRFPGEARFPRLAAIAEVSATVAEKGRTRRETRYFISSRPMQAKDFAAAVRAHWAIETSLHWVLDVTFKDDLSRVRTGHGAHNMALVRHFAFNLVRQAGDKKSLKLRRKRAGWDHNYLASLLLGTQEPAR